MTKPKPATKPKPNTKPASKTWTITAPADDEMASIAVPFDPVAVFGKVRAPVTVTLRGYTYRNTIFRMGERTFIPLRRSHREAAGVHGGERLRVTVALDEAKREVTAPKDLLAALNAAGARAAWAALAYSHQREHVDAIEGAVKPETRARRITAAVAMVARKAGLR